MINQIKGIPASPGTFKGETCLVKSLQDFSKFGSGMVLVSETTNPVWTPLICAAGAVVTDLGGSLSHAAIVSREYRIPAVVGTKVATRILKDGDLVEVDGSEGLVTIIK